MDNTLFPLLETQSPQGRETSGANTQENKKERLKGL